MTYYDILYGVFMRTLLLSVGDIDNIRGTEEPRQITVVCDILLYGVFVRTLLLSVGDIDNIGGRKSPGKKTYSTRRLEEPPHFSIVCYFLT